MKQIAFITTRRVLAQSLADAVKARPELGFEFHLLLDIKQAPLDAEVFEADIVVIDMADGTAKGQGETLALCEKLHRTSPNSKLLLLLSQEDNRSRKLAIKAAQNAKVDDFVFHDTSLDYLFAKLAAV